MDIVATVLKSRKSYLLGERKVADTLYLTQDDLDRLNNVMREKIEDEHEHRENAAMFPDLLPPAIVWTDVNFGDLFFGMEITETDDNVKSQTVTQLVTKGDSNDQHGKEQLESN